LAFFNLGVIHHRKGETEKGIKYWEDVVSIPMTTADALIEAEEIELAAAANMNLGAHYVLNKELEKGLGFLQAAAELDPDDGEIRYNLAAALTANGKHEDAIREFEASAERGVDMAKEIIKKLKEGLVENERKEKGDAEK
jgi:tetratricopeptide (TPR) repeat protein